MAHWTIRRNRKGTLDFNYKNCITGQIHHCGELRSSTTKREILEWVMRQGEPGTGDLIKFDDGTVFMVQPDSIQDTMLSPLSPVATA